MCLNGTHHRIYTGHAEMDCGDYYPDWFEIILETLGRYIGLKDKDGKKTFEGAIIVKPYDTPITKYVVTYNAEIATFVGEEKRGCVKYCTTFADDSDAFEIIGNIHDNKEQI